jgi:hypothetical protein
MPRPTTTKQEQDEQEEEREYQEASARLRVWRKSELLRKLAAIPKPPPPASPRPNVLDLVDPLGIGSAGTRKKVQR